ncbi:unnamed protein product [Caenorhabditis nigoni]
MPKWSGVHHHKDGLGKPRNIEEAPTMVISRRVAKDAKQYFLEDESNTTPSSRISEDAPSKSTLLSEEKSPTSTDNDAMNGRSTLPKATQQHGRHSDQLTKGTWKFQQRLEGNTNNNLYAVMDEQSSHQTQQLDEEVYRKPTRTPSRRSLQEPSQLTNSTATSTSLFTSEDVHWITAIQ